MFSRSLKRFRRQGALLVVFCLSATGWTVFQYRKCRRKGFRQHIYKIEWHFIDSLTEMYPFLWLRWLIQLNYQSRYFNQKLILHSSSLLFGKGHLMGNWNYILTARTRLSDSRKEIVSTIKKCTRRPKFPWEFPGPRIDANFCRDRY